MKNIFRKISSLAENGKECVIVTVVEKKGHGPSRVGRKMVVTADIAEGTIGGGSLELLAIKESKEVLGAGESRLKRYILEDSEEKVGEKTGMLCGGEVLLFFEYIGSKENIFIFGAGHIGRSIVGFMKHLDYRINIFDTREEQLNDSEDLKEVHIENIDSFFENIKYMTNGYIVIATHSHDLDYKIVKKLVDSGIKFKYLGMIASEKKIKSMKERYQRENGSDLNLSSVYSPAGLNIGGSTPSEIALSVVAEIQSVKYKIEKTVSISKIKGIKYE